jgi:hypothetical protein
MMSVRPRLDSRHGIAAVVIGLGAVVAASLMHTGPAGGATQADSVRPANAIAALSKQARPSVLYVQMARRGSLSRADRRGRATLTLKGVSPAMLFFSDRPERVAGQTATRSFVAGWRRAFGNDPPNAALSVLRRGTGRDLALELLRRPRYNARTATLTYRIRRLDDADAGLFPSRFNHASLIIDSAPDTHYLLTVTLANGRSYGDPMALDDIRGVNVTARGDSPDEIRLVFSEGPDEHFRFNNNTEEAKLGVALSSSAQPDVPFARSTVPRGGSWEYEAPSFR